MSCDQITESGAYVLGILDPDEHAAYERHLATCAACQREVADLSGLPAVLAQLGPDEAMALSADEPEPRRSGRGGVADLGAYRRGAGDPGAARRGRHAEDAEPMPPVPLRPLPSVPRADTGFDPGPRGTRWQERGGQRRPSRWRSVVAGLSAAACLAVGILLGARLFAPEVGPRPSDMTAMQPVAASVPITAQVALAPFAGGTEVRMHCVYNGGSAGGPRWSLRMIVYPKNGEAPEQVSSWTAAHGDDVTVSAATRIAPADIGKIEIRKVDNTPLLVYERA
ncbi:anti-sigma factor family protein [Planosporangium sp. 12N6]|uniref:anti-sigma factor n=1 Tax=Planosporangium spinosum TaxID=3402278 RepID=UPI003CEBEA01